MSWRTSSGPADSRLGCGRAKGFYEGLGWRLDADLVVDDGYRVVQLTPPGSGCSIIFGTGVTSARPARPRVSSSRSTTSTRPGPTSIARGVDVSEPFHDVTGIFHHAGTEGRLDGAAPEHADYGSFAVLRRSGRQRLAAPGDQDPAPRPLRGAARWPRRTSP